MRFKIKGKFLLFTLGLISLFGFTFLGASILVNQKANAATSITISYPTNGQTFTGNSFTISGTTDPNSTVLIQKSQTTIKQTKSDGSGNWTAQLSNLPDGNNIITAKVVKNSGYAYFISSTDFSNFKINQFRLSDNSINPNNTYPLSITAKKLIMNPSNIGGLFYLMGDPGSPTTPPYKFDSTNPSDPVVVSGSYPNDARPNKGDYSADGSKYYSPNLQTASVSVVDVATNAWVKNISTPIVPRNVSLGPNGLLYVSNGSHDIYIIDPATDTLKPSATNICPGNTDQGSVFAAFSDDPTYEYYFVTCNFDGSIKKVKISDNSIVSSFATSNISVIGMVFSADTKLAYLYATVLQPGSLGTDKIQVINTDTGALVHSIQLQSGIAGLLPSPDYQKLYVTTPNEDFSVKNIDVVDMQDYSVQHVSLGNEIAVAISANKSTTKDIAGVNVGVVLGVATGGTLANTGALAIPATLLLGIILASVMYTYMDYKKHKRPLMAIDPSAKHTYTYMHHIKTVTIPLMKYRMQFSIIKVPTNEGPFTKF